MRICVKYCIFMGDFEDKTRHIVFSSVLGRCSKRSGEQCIAHFGEYCQYANCANRQLDLFS